jgi:hypothetical protein
VARELAGDRAGGARRRDRGAAIGAAGDAGQAIEQLGAIFDDRRRHDRREPGHAIRSPQRSLDGGGPGERTLACGLVEIAALERGAHGRDPGRAHHDDL